MGREQDELNNHWLGYITNLPAAGGTRNRPNRNIAPPPNPILPVPVLAPAPTKAEAVHPTASSTPALPEPAKRPSSTKIGPSRGVPPSQRLKAEPKTRRAVAVTKTAIHRDPVRESPEPARVTSKSQLPPALAAEESESDDEEEEGEGAESSSSESDASSDSDSDLDEGAAHSGDEDENEDEDDSPGRGPVYDPAEGIAALANRPIRVAVKPQSQHGKKGKRK